MLPILAASGLPGPKLRQGDGQVPEGIYAVPALNPNSRFHLSIMLDYPNAYDVAVAEAEGRTDLGGEIFIHGGAASIGCLAIGDDAIERLFVLVADVGIENVAVIVAPHDPRGGIGLDPVAGLPFTAGLYGQIEAALAAFRAPAGS
jgi:murein L,D-transpeptidase YafK